MQSRRRRKSDGPWIRRCTEPSPHAILLPVAIVVSLFISGTSFAFHSGGTGFCAGCHRSEMRSHRTVATDHGPGGWIPTDTAGALLRGLDASSTCLRCHAGSLDAPSVLGRQGAAHTSGGDFYWLKRSFSWVENGRQLKSSGESHGHNIVALEYGLRADSRNSSAPGGSYPTAAMSCTSCHDPHAVKPSPSTSELQANQLSRNLGAPKATYRLLAGRGYVPRGSVAAFDHAAPVAVASPQRYSESDADHPAYGSGMSEWCSNCHGALSKDGPHRTHASGRHALLGKKATIYNAYIKSGDLSGTRNNAYLALVPFETNTSDPQFLNPLSRLGPTHNASVMCVTCHRAHASPFANAGRWDFQATFLSQSHPQIGDLGATVQDVGARYGRESIVSRFGKYQRQLCNKCHGMD